MGLGSDAVLEARVEGGRDSIYYQYAAQSVLSMLPEARRTGIDTFDEASEKGLGDRLMDEVLEVGTSLAAWPVVCVSARLPQGAVDQGDPTTVVIRAVGALDPAIALQLELRIRSAAKKDVVRWK